MYWEAPTCVICLSELSTDLTATPCGHIFHRNCIENCLFNQCKNCPLCRNKVVPSKLTNLSYTLNPTKVETPKISGLSEEESKDMQALQSKTREVIKEKEIIEAQLRISGIHLIEREEQLKMLQEILEEEKSKTKNFKRRYEEVLAERTGLQYESEKYQGLFNNAHKRLKEVESRLSTLENISNLLDELEKTKSTMAWANQAKEILSAEDQATNFYNALLISSDSLKTREKEMKELKDLNNESAQQQATTKRQLIQARKELDIMQKRIADLETQTSTSSLKRKFEDSPKILIENEAQNSYSMANKPKRTLSLLSNHK